MTLNVTHLFVSGKSNGADPTLVQPSDWNAKHTLAQLPGTLLGAFVGGLGQTIEIPIAVDVNGNTHILSTGFFTPPTGTTGQRPGSPSPAQMRYNTTLSVPEYYDGAWRSFASQTYVAAQIAAASFVAPGYLWGLTLGAVGGSSIFSIGAGTASDSTNTSPMVLAAAITKTTAAWVVGSANGSLDTGVIAPSTWYAVYEIKRVDTGVVDILTSLNPVTPTLPASYTLFRRIGFMLTDGASQWIAFSQMGDQFLWLTIMTDFVGFADIAVGLKPLRVPPGVQVIALFRAQYNTGTGDIANFFWPGVTFSGLIGLGHGASISGSGFGVASGEYAVRTNTASQIAVAASSNGGNLDLDTIGWIDRRGRDS